MVKNDPNFIIILVRVKNNAEYNFKLRILNSFLL